MLEPFFVSHVTSYLAAMFILSQIFQEEAYMVTSCRDLVTYLRRLQVTHAQVCYGWFWASLLKPSHCRPPSVGPSLIISLSSETWQNFEKYYLIESTTPCERSDSRGSSENRPDFYLKCTYKWWTVLVLFQKPYLQASIQLYKTSNDKFHF